MTPEGKERSRAANLKHGLYSKEKAQALRALGEDPADLADLVAGCYQQWDPSNRQECDLVARQAQLQWCMSRAARRQEHFQARYLAKVAADRQEKALQLRYHNQDQITWLSLAYRHARRPDYYATPGCIARFQKAFMGEIPRPQPIGDDESPKSTVRGRSDTVPMQHGPDAPATTDGRSDAMTPTAMTGLPNSTPPAAGNIKNAGATGDMLENKGTAKTTVTEIGHPAGENTASRAAHNQAKSAAGGSMKA